MGTSNIVHQYFKKEKGEEKILIKVDPIHWKGIEIVIVEKSEPETNEIELTQTFESDLIAEGFEPCNPMEFNLYWSGLL